MQIQMRQRMYQVCTWHAPEKDKKEQSLVPGARVENDLRKAGKNQAGQRDIVHTYY